VPSPQEEGVPSPELGVLRAGQPLTIGAPVDAGIVGVNGVNGTAAEINFQFANTGDAPLTLNALSLTNKSNSFSVDSATLTNGTNLQNISDMGQLLGYYYDMAYRQEWFVYRNAIFTSLTGPTVGATGLTAANINDMGQVGGTYQDGSGGQQGFIYDVNSNSYTVINDPNSTAAGSTVESINNSSDVLGSYIDTNGNEVSFVYTSDNQVYRDLADPLAGTNPSVALGLNDAGQVLGTYQDGTGTQHGFIYDASGGTYRDITDPDQAAVRGTNVDRINNLGLV
jgi:hypothetical protein